MLVTSIITVAVAITTGLNAQTLISTSGLPAAQVPGFPQDKCPKTFFENANYAKFLGCIETSSMALNALSDECKKTDKQTVGDNPTSAPSWPPCSCDAHNVFPKCIEDAGICPDGIKAYRDVFPGKCGNVSTSGLPAAQVAGFPQEKCPKTFFENVNYARFLGCIETSTKALSALSDVCKKTDKEVLGDNPSSAASWPSCSCDAHNAFPECIEDAGICADGIKAYRSAFPGTCAVASTSLVATTAVYTGVPASTTNLVYSGAAGVRAGLLGVFGFVGLMV
ncbi:hypothetical protein HDU97_004957 [Phlyctochytrium planicorne]|nr:hypothetical protein HDU97_004957 [Phlyctochytrium planicorne]